MFAVAFYYIICNYIYFVLTIIKGAEAGLQLFYICVYTVHILFSLNESEINLTSLYTGLLEVLPLTF